MNNLQIFKNENFGEIQIIEENGKFEFEATGSARILGYVNPYDAIQRHCKKDGVVKHEVIDNLGRKQEKNFIDEGNLYRLITHSKLPSAEKFESWVFDEVLPSIRKYGTYMTPDKIEEVLINPDTIIQLATTLKQEREEKQRLQLANTQQKELLEEQKPKVLFANSVEASKTSILIGELAKILKQNGFDIGQNRLFEWLRQNGYLISRQGTDYNTPTQKAMNLGIFEVKETSISHSDGHISISKTTKVTRKADKYTLLISF